MDKKNEVKKIKYTNADAITGNKNVVTIKGINVPFGKFSEGSVDETIFGGNDVIKVNTTVNTYGLESLDGDDVITISRAKDNSSNVDKDVDVFLNQGIGENTIINKTSKKRKPATVYIENLSTSDQLIVKGLASPLDRYGIVERPAGATYPWLVSEKNYNSLVSPEFFRIKDLDGSPDLILM